MDQTLTAIELQRFRQAGRLRLLIDLSLPWLQIGLGLAVYAWSPSAVGFAFAFVMVAGGQNGLLLATHEFSHAGVLPGRRGLNDALATWLFAAPLGIGFSIYRHRHEKHHRLYGTEGDTKTAYRQDIRGPRFWPFLLRNLSGFEFAYHVVEVLAQAAREGQPGPKVRRALAPIVLAQAALLAAFVPLQPAGPLGYLALWLLPLVTLTTLYQNLRALVDHQPAMRAGARDSGFFRGTSGPFVRSVRASWLERLTLTRLHFGHHAEHHAYPQVSYQHLPEVAGIFEERGRFDADWLERERTCLSTLAKLRRDEPPAYHRQARVGIAKTGVAECPACGSPESTVLFDVRDHEYTTTTSDDFMFVTCRACDTWYLDPRPDETTLDVIYPPNYGDHVADRRALEMLEADAPGLSERLSRRRFMRSIGPVRRWLAMDESTRWLDVGCGNGAALGWIQRAFGASGVGLDRSESGVRVCARRGFEAHVGRFEDWNAKGDTFDLVYSSHLIEHVASPREFLEKVHALLIPRGVCAIVTPSTDTWEARLLGRHWGGLHAPRHFSLLNDRAVRTLAASTGFEHLETSYFPNPAFWTATLHSLSEPVLGRDVADWLFPSDHRGIEPGVWHAARGLAFTLLDLANRRLFKRSSNMLVVLRKL